MEDGSVTVTAGGRQQHDPTGVRLLEETQVNAKRVRIRAALGTEFGVVNDYVLERSAYRWHIASMRKIDVIYAPSLGLGGRLRRLLGRE